jgi:hypothetical protein
MTKPRWSYFRREGTNGNRVFRALFTRILKDMSVKDIDEKLKTAISHDDPPGPRHRRIAFRHPRRAESLELALFACPACGALHRSRQNEQVFCRPLRLLRRVRRRRKLQTARQRRSPTGFDFGIKPVSGELPLRILKNWDLWQKTYLEQRIARDFLVNPEQPHFQRRARELAAGETEWTPWISRGKGRLSLNSRYLLLRQPGGGELKIEVADIDGPVVLKWNFFEFYVGKTVYRARFDDKTASGYKYAMALEALAALREKLAGAKKHLDSRLQAQALIRHPVKAPPRWRPSPSFALFVPDLAWFGEAPFFRENDIR